MTKAESLPITKRKDGVVGLNKQYNRMIMKCWSSSRQGEEYILDHPKQWIEIVPVAVAVLVFLSPFTTKAESLPITKSRDGVVVLNHQ